jgi:divalent metal cation (Fe/Co/Zn/Cd) transporter
VAVLIFGLGGGISLYEGILHTLDPGHGGPTGATLFGVTIGGLTLNTIVLVSAIIFEGFAFRTAWQEFNKVRGDRDLLAAIRSSKDPTTFTVLFEDSAAMAGLIVALLGVHLTEALHMPVIDGIASILIGLILCGVASFLVWESKKLLLGEAAGPELRAGLRRIAHDDPDVEDVVRSMTLHMGPNALVLNMDLKFMPSLSAEEVARAVDRVERRIRDEHPEVRFVFIETESLSERRRTDAATS